MTLLTLLLLGATSTSVALETRPAGAAISVDGALLGAAPWSGRLASGRHALEVHLDGYAPISRSLEVGSTAVHELIELTRDAAHLAIAVDPPGSMVQVDGRPSTPAPLSADVPPGEHWVSASHPGFAQHSEAVTLLAGQSLSRELKLLPTPVALRVEASPPIPVGVDGEPFLLTPWTRQVDAGSHTLAFDGGTQTLTVEGSTMVVFSFAATARVEQTADAGVAAAGPLDASAPDAGVGVVAAIDGGAVEAPGNALLAQLDLITSAQRRLELCQEWAARLPMGAVAVTSADLSGTAVEAEVLVDEHSVGKTPLVRVLPVCAKTLTVVRPDGRTEFPLRLVPAQVRVIEVKHGGTGSLSAISGVFDLTLFPQPVQFASASGGAVDPTSTAFGGGVRYDHWGQVLHTSVSLGVQTLYAPVIQALFGVSLPVLPSLDVFLGPHLRLGSESVPVLVGIDVGLWHLLHPAARATLAVKVGDFVLSVSGDARYLWPFQVLFTTVSPDLNANPLAFGVTASAGFGW